MRQTPKNIHSDFRPYRVELTAASWSQLGTVPEPVFKAIRRTLDDLARDGDSEPHPRAAGNALERFGVGDYRVTCQWEDARRTLLLVSVEPARATPPEKSPARPVGVPSVASGTVRSAGDDVS